MSKIICEVCGTSYPETAAQCPICGCVHRARTRSTSANKPSQSSSGSNYTYVKGGRFSQSNVRKRTGAATPAPSAKSGSNHSRKKKKQPDNRGLVITIIILLVAIFAVIGYIYVKFFMPTRSSGSAVKPPISNMEELDSNGGSKACEEIILDVHMISFSAAGESAAIHASAVPADTKDQMIFTTDNDTIASVSENGEVLAVGPGEAVITVSCGNISTQCAVICSFEDGSVISGSDDGFRLNREKISFQNAGESWIVYTGDIPAEDITWTIENEAVATVANGKVTAVSNGTTVLFAEYNGTKLSCDILCQLDDSTSVNDGNGAQSQDDAGDNGPYKLYNIYGDASDVSIRMNESFTLQLIDKDGKAVSGVTWSIKEGSSCTVDDGKVTAVSSGKSIVLATYNGKEYTCIVRVS